MVDWQMLGYKGIELTVVAPQTQPPDVEISVSPQNPNLNDTVSVTVKITAHDPVSDATVTLFLEKDSHATQVDQRNIGDIGENEVKTVTFSFKPADYGLKEGDTAKVYATLYCSLNGQPTRINSNAVTLSIAQGLKKPVVKVTTDKTTYQVGDTARITIEVNNENNFSVEATYGIYVTLPNGSVKTILDKTATIQANDSIKDTIEYTFTEAGTYQFKGQAIFRANGQESSAYSNTVMVQVNQNAPPIAEPSVSLKLDRSEYTAGDTGKATVTVRNNDSNHSIVHVDITIQGNGITIGQLSQATQIGPGESKDFTVTVTFDNPGDVEVKANVKTKFDDGSVFVSATNSVHVTVKPSGNESASVKIQHPEQANAGDTVPFTIELTNTGTVTITDAQLTFKATQYDENGNVVATTQNSLPFNTPIEPGNSDTLNVLVSTKDVAGTLTVDFTIGITFSTGKTMTKTASSSVPLVKSGGGTGGGGGSGGGGGTGGGTGGTEIADLISKTMEFVKTHPLIVGGVVAGVVLLLLLGRRGNQVVYAPPAPAYPYYPR